MITIKVLLKKGYKYGGGLGKSGQGSIFPLEVIENKSIYGMGYEVIKMTKERLAKEKRGRRWALLKGCEPRKGRILVCDIN